jgi:hypothetical protein
MAPELLYTLCGIVVATAGSSAGLGWWLSGQFRKQDISRDSIKEELTNRISEARDAIDDQIRSHERLDDERFGMLRQMINDKVAAQDLAIMRLELAQQNQGRIGPHEI